MTIERGKVSMQDTEDRTHKPVVDCCGKVVVGT